MHTRRHGFGVRPHILLILSSQRIASSSQKILGLNRRLTIFAAFRMVPPYVSNQTGASTQHDALPHSGIPLLSHETLAEMVGTTRSRITYFMNCLLYTSDAADERS